MIKYEVREEDGQFNIYGLDENHDLHFIDSRETYMGALRATDELVIRARNKKSDTVCYEAFV